MPAGRQEGESMKAVVTVFGGSGFLGRRVVRRLLESGFAVRVATRHPQPSDRPGLTQVAADANDECARSEENTSELQSLMSNSYPVIGFKKTKITNNRLLQRINSTDKS